jgi:elongation factor P--(R)-beta-lysine ligase
MPMNSLLAKAPHSVPTRSWWSPEAHAARRPYLAARGRIVAGLRRWFEAEGFFEVEAGALQVSPGNETHLHAFSTDLVGTDGERSRLYLQTSPELAMKKLLAAGEERIVDFARVFRNRERSALHHPEFTLVEWYRAHESYERVMADCAAILAEAAKAADAKTLRFRGREADPFAEPERITVAEAFARFSDIELMAALPADPKTRPHPDRLALEAQGAGIRVAADDTWSDIFSKILTERIEPQLGLGRATILYDYPASEAALARRKPSDPRLCERFELYACGVELANAFGELTDPVEQRRRFEADMAEKERIYGERYPIDEEFLAALALMPPASGAALGLDRLVMLATGAERIEDVIWTPMPEEDASP